MAATEPFPFLVGGGLDGRVYVPPPWNRGAKDFYGYPL